MTRKMTLVKFKKFIPLYFMMLPGLVYLFINNYIPMAGIVIAFKKYNVNKGIWGSPWNGFSNFEFLFSTNEAAVIIRNTLLYNVAFIIINNIVAIALAIMITDVISQKLKKLYQSSILLPFLISIVVVSYIVFALFSSENGMVNNSVLPFFGLEPKQWYNSPRYWPAILIITSCWKSVGYGTLIFIAAIAGIDKTFYEAAEIDGAKKWQLITKITLPFLIPAIIILLIMSVGKIFYSDFGLFYQVPQNSGSLYSVTNTIDTYIYRALIAAGGMGRSSAAGVFQSFVGFLLVMITNGIVRKMRPENAIF